MKCAVYRCENHDDQGLFVGLLCSPCHSFISGPFTKGGHSQASRNVKAVLMVEREANAKVCEDLYADLLEDADCRKHWPDQLFRNKTYAAAIRARGNQ